MATGLLFLMSRKVSLLFQYPLQTEAVTAMAQPLENPTWMINNLPRHTAVSYYFALAENLFWCILKSETLNICESQCNSDSQVYQCFHVLIIFELNHWFQDFFPLFVSQLPVSEIFITLSKRPKQHNYKLNVQFLICPLAYLHTSQFSFQDFHLAQITSINNWMALSALLWSSSTIGTLV